MTQTKAGIKNSIALILASLFWGISFVAQSTGGDAVGPFSFNSIRCLIGGLSLLPVILGMRIYSDSHPTDAGIATSTLPSADSDTDTSTLSSADSDTDTSTLSSVDSDTDTSTLSSVDSDTDTSTLSSADSDTDTSITPSTDSFKTLLIGGVCCGILLCLGSNLQQIGIALGSPVGKAGFLTACYIILVPILGIFLKKHCSILVWIGVFLTLIGLYLLCMNGSFSLQTSDILLLIGAFTFALHILVIDYFSPKADGVCLSCIQFFVSGLLTAIPMFWSEMHHSIHGILSWSSAFCSLDAWIPILYAGIVSCGGGYTLQIIGQKGMNPTVASLLLSLESVFSVLAGWILLRQTLSIREITGCILIFAAIILAQLPTRR